MVSDTVEVVSVVWVIVPCVKLGTTGTALAGAARQSNSKNEYLLTITPYWILSSVTCWPVATVPAPPAVTVIAPALVIVPASVPAVPALVEV